ncbi:MAG: SDR family oxidoreductase [Nocardioidaceae bacterium]
MTNTQAPILVTGAGSGMGQATARRLLAGGRAVVATDINLDALSDLAGNDDLKLVRSDLREPEKLVAELQGQPLGGIVTAAGLGPEHPVAHDVFLVNGVSPFAIMEGLVGQLVPGASIVNYASMVAHLSDEKFDDVLENPLDPTLRDRTDLFKDAAEAYVYSKRRIWKGSLEKAVEWAPDVRVNAISPGIIDTPMTKRGQANDEWTRKTTDRIPMKRLGTPDEAAQVVEFLLGATYLTGVLIPVDGGALTARNLHVEKKAKAAAAENASVS